MKTFNLKSVLSFFILLFYSYTFFGNGLYFSVKVEGKQIEEAIKEYKILRETKEYVIAGEFSQYIEALKAKQEISKLNIKTLEVVAFFNHQLISIEDAFAIIDDRNEQDQKNNGYILTETEMSNMLLEVQDQAFFYTVQMGLFTEQNVNDFFDFPKQYSETITTKGNYRYTYGKFTTLNDAKDALKMVKEYGLDNAFIVAFDNLERIPLERAIAKEQQAFQEALASQSD